MSNRNQSLDDDTDVYADYSLDRKDRRRSRQQKKKKSDKKRDKRKNDMNEFDDLSYEEFFGR
jgi:hypothetical protein